jgi:hypothetical protein
MIGIKQVLNNIIIMIIIIVAKVATRLDAYLWHMKRNVI